MSDSISILNEVFDVTIDGFLAMMWSEGDFWKNLSEKLGIFDFEEVERNSDRIATKSKVKMVSNDILAKLMPSLPTHCDQEGEILISREDPNKVLVEQFVNSQNYPYAESFTIVQIYSLSKEDKGTRVSVKGEIRWKDSINFMVKPFIKKDVHKTLANYGTLLSSALRSVNGTSV